VAPDGKVTLLSTEMERPNGIGLSPDEKTLYVANSHGPRMILMAFPVKPDGTLDKGRVFFDCRPLARKWGIGSADGMAIDEHGNVWTTAPAGVAIISPDGKHLGSLITTQRTANCKFGEDGSTLFIAADDYFLRIRLTTKGTGF
jgi:gluconolactonase